MKNEDFLWNSIFETLPQNSTKKKIETLFLIH